jgi:hypothetical protein
MAAGDMAAAGTTGITTITVAGAMAVGTTGIPITTVAGATAAAGIIGITGISGDFNDDWEERGFGPFLFYASLPIRVQAYEIAAFEM